MMSLPSPKIIHLIRKLFAQMGSPDNDAEVARRKLNKILAEYGLSWNDLSTILAVDIDALNEGDAAPPDADAYISDVLGVVLALIDEHVGVTADQRLVLGLWILHASVLDRFEIAATRLALSGEGGGKTTVPSLIELLISEGNRTDHTTAAAIYHELDERPGAVLLIDEADGLNLQRVLPTVPKASWRANVAQPAGYRGRQNNALNQGGSREDKHVCGIIACVDVYRRRRSRAAGAVQRDRRHHGALAHHLQ
jgi:hypothetical protein